MDDPALRRCVKLDKRVKNRENGEYVAKNESIKPVSVQIAVHKDVLHIGCAASCLCKHRNKISFAPVEKKTKSKLGLHEIFKSTQMYRQAKHVKRDSVYTTRLAFTERNCKIN